MVKKYIEELNKQIKTLKPYSNQPERTQESVSPIPFIADFAILQYSALANSIDNKSFRSLEMQTESFHKAVIFVNRSIILNYVSCIESLLQTFCIKNKIEVSSLDSRRATTINNQLNDQLNSKNKKWLKGKQRSMPIFSDYSNAVLKEKGGADSDFSKKWKDFFNLLTLLRNKSAHGDSKLSGSDIKTIKKIKSEFNFEQELGVEFNLNDDLQIPVNFLQWSFEKLQNLASEINK